MRKWIATAAGLALAFAAAAAPPYEHKTIPGASPEPLAQGGRALTREDVEAFFDGLMAAHLRYKPLAGATVSVVKDGEVLLVKGYGFADREKQVPVDGERSLFRPGSTSKLFTWTAVMQLVEQGKLDLDADVNQYLPNFKIPEAHGRPITLRNVMTHTAGLEDGGVGYLFAKDAASLIPLADALPRYLPARVRAPTTEFGADGTNASYSNWATALAGHIVASVSGMPFDDYVATHIFAPLEMTSSTFAEPLPPELAPRMAVGYTWKAGRLEPHGFEFVHSFGPAGSLTSSAADMAKFMIAHLNDGEFRGRRILRPETAQLMHSAQFKPSPYVNGSGLGFYETWVNGRRLIGHGGDMLAFHTDLALLKEAKVGIFVSYNASHDEAPHVARRDLVKGFMDRYFPARLPQVKAPDDFQSRAAQYAGTYRGNRMSYTTWEKFFALTGATKVAPTADNTLLITDLMLPGPSYWVEVAPHTFREVDGEEMIAFVEQDGAITHAVGSFAFIGLHRIGWWETPGFHYVVLGFGALCFLLAVIGAVRHWRADRAAPAGARRARRLAGLTGLVQLAFLAMLVVIASGDLEDLFLELPTSLFVALALPLVAVPLTAGMLYFAWSAWRQGFWTRWGRVRYTIVALAAAAFLWSLSYWNMLGYHFA